MQEAKTNIMGNSDDACCYMPPCIIKSGVLDLCPCAFLHFLSLPFLSSRLATMEMYSFFFIRSCSPVAPTSLPHAFPRNSLSPGIRMCLISPRAKQRLN